MNATKSVELSGVTDIPIITGVLEQIASNKRAAEEKARRHFGPDDRATTNCADKARVFEDLVAVLQSLNPGDSIDIT